MRYTSHCLSATGPTSLNETGCQTRNIMLMMWYENEASLRSYSCGTTYDQNKRTTVADRDNILNVYATYGTTNDSYFGVFLNVLFIGKLQSRLPPLYLREVSFLTFLTQIRRVYNYGQEPPTYQEPPISYTSSHQKRMSAIPTDITMGICNVNETVVSPVKFKNEVERNQASFAVCSTLHLQVLIMLMQCLLQVHPQIAIPAFTLDCLTRHYAVLPPVNTTWVCGKQNTKLFS